MDYLRAEENLQLLFGKWIDLPDPKRTPGIPQKPHQTRHSIHKLVSHQDITMPVCHPLRATVKQMKENIIENEVKLGVLMKFVKTIIHICMLNKHGNCLAYE
jgi:hypothetical protein